MELPATLASPIAGAPALAERIERIATAGIVERYREQLGCDVTGYFKGIDEVGIYRCQATGFKFFYPYGLAGAADFYAQIDSVGK